MREPEDLLPPHSYLHGANLSQWKCNGYLVIIQSANIIEDAECSGALTRLERIKSKLLRDKGYEPSEYQKKVS